MIINIEKNLDKTEPRCGLCTKLKSLLCYMSIGNVVIFTCIFMVVILLLYLGKTYIRTVLLWLENQDSVIVSLTIIILFIIVSFPISVGYIVLVVASGYLFSITRGLLLAVMGANTGLLVAHNIIKLLGHHKSIRSLMDTELAKAITRVISGPLSFKIVFCARLTPIPFGLQNTIFALSNVSGNVYHVASLIGLLPAQMVAVCAGSTLRSMQDVLENKHIPTTTYFFVAAQLIFGASVMIWITAKARTELMKALNEANGKLGLSDSFNIV